MINEVLEERYVDLDVLFELLTSLFGEGNFEVEVS